MEDHNLIVGHALLGHDDLLAAIDYEVAALVVLTVLATPHSVVLRQAVQLAELRPKHDGDLANHDSGCIMVHESLDDLALPLASLLVHLELISVQLLLRQDDVDEELGGVSEVPHPGLMREDRAMLVILLSDVRA